MSIDSPDTFRRFLSRKSTEIVLDFTNRISHNWNTSWINGSSQSVHAHRFRTKLASSAWLWSVLLSRLWAFLLGHSLLWLLGSCRILASPSALLLNLSYHFAEMQSNDVNTSVGVHVYWSVGTRARGAIAPCSSPSHAQRIVLLILGAMCDSDANWATFVVHITYPPLR